MAIHLLIIEAENRYRLNLAQRLRGEGFTVFGATARDDVEGLLKQEDIDVVLLGIDGLGREGLGLIRLVRSVRPATQIIIINDPRRMDLSIEGMKLGAFDDFLIPLDVDAMVARIRAATDKHPA